MVSFGSSSCLLVFPKYHNLNNVKIFLDSINI